MEEHPQIPTASENGKSQFGWKNIAIISFSLISGLVGVLVLVVGWNASTAISDAKINKAEIQNVRENYISKTEHNADICEIKEAIKELKGDFKDAVKELKREIAGGKRGSKGTD